MWRLYIPLAYSEWPVPTAEYHVSEFIPTDLNHCHLCRRTHRALIWAELRAVSGMVPDKELEAMPCVLLSTHTNCSLKSRLKSQVGMAWRARPWWSPRRKGLGEGLGVSHCIAKAGTEFSADHSSNGKWIMGRKLRSSFLFVSIIYLRHL